MISDLVGAEILLRAIGLGIVPGIAVLVFIVVSVVLKFLSAKQEKDRAEHMDKWNSMIALQDKMIKTHRESMDQIISGNREDVDRLYQLYKEQNDSLKVLAHNISSIATVIERKTFCPNDLKGGRN